uniref:Uncharacterized protein n=1 Tax=Timema genevievae TaxID=629358 RepID=A0A7R9K2M7_TIMGE|nr:unnamed protein product [Timema genevievae]
MYPHLFEGETEIRTPTYPSPTNQSSSARHQFVYERLPALKERVGGGWRRKLRECQEKGGRVEVSASAAQKTFGRHCHGNAIPVGMGSLCTTRVVAHSPLSQVVLHLYLLMTRLVQWRLELWKQGGTCSPERNLTSMLANALVVLSSTAEDGEIEVGRRVHRDEAEGVLESVTCQRLVKIASDISP